MKKNPLVLFSGLCLISFFSLSSMLGMSLGVLIFLVCFCYHFSDSFFSIKKIKELFYSPVLKTYYRLSFLLSGCCFFSLLLNCFFPLAYGGKTPEIHLISDMGKVWYFFLPPLYCLSWKALSEIQRLRVIQCWWGSFVFFSSIGVIQFFTGWPMAAMNHSWPQFYHPILFLGHHLAVSNIWIFPFFSFLSLSLSSYRSSLVSFPLLILSLGLGLFILLTNNSRILWIAFPFGWAILIFLHFSLSRALKINTVMMMTSFLILFFVPFFKKRLDSPAGIRDRVELWKANKEFFFQRPLLGIGFGKNDQMAQYYFESIPEKKNYFVGRAHNIYLHMLSGTGICGLLSWLSWIYFIFSLAWKGCDRKNTHPFSPGWVSAWIVFLIAGLTETHLMTGKICHQVMWVTGMILFFSDTQKRLPFFPSPELSE